MNVITEKEAVKRERAAYNAGVNALHAATTTSATPHYGAYRRVLNRDRETYPLPKVKRDRVAGDPHGASFGITIDQVFLYWKVEGSSVVPCDHSGAVISPPNSSWSPAISIERTAVWADLLANPTELVEDLGT